MFSPYRGRSHTKKQNQNCKPPISAEEKKLRDQKKCLAKIFENIKFRQENKLNVVEISYQASHRFKTGNYKSIYKHALKQNHPNGGKSPSFGGGFRGRLS